eukprot:scaffold872_cov421-Prasinococcus_capsulatus_cf.AAC.17
MKAALPQCTAAKTVSVRSNKPVAPLHGVSFTGMHSHSLGLRAEREGQGLVKGAVNGFKWVCMRHRKRIPKLNRPADQRKALLRGLTTVKYVEADSGSAAVELLRHGRIITTKARAKAMRKPVEHMITLAKRNTLHSRRQALAYIYDEQLVNSLFEGVGERYADRNGRRKASSRTRFKGGSLSRLDLLNAWTRMLSVQVATPASCEQTIAGRAKASAEGALSFTRMVTYGMLQPAVRTFSVHNVRLDLPALSTLRVPCLRYRERFAGVEWNRFHNHLFHWRGRNDVRHFLQGAQRVWVILRS